MRLSKLNQTFSLKKAQQVVEILSFPLIALGGLYPYINYHGLQAVSEIIYLFLIVVGGGVYLIFRNHISAVVSQDGLDLLRIGGMIFWLVTVLLFLFAIFPTALRGEYAWSGDPVPANLREKIGFAVALPAMISAMLFPYFRLIRLLERPSRGMLASVVLVVLTIMITLITDSTFLQVVGFGLSLITPNLLKTSD